MCAESYFRIAGACIDVAAIMKRTYSPVDYPHYPLGCYWHRITGGVYLNGDRRTVTIITNGSSLTYTTEGTGAANPFAQPLCAGAAQPPHD